VEIERHHYQTLKTIDAEGREAMGIAGGITDEITVSNFANEVFGWMVKTEMDVADQAQV
jgi:hypothetical protein